MRHRRAALAERPSIKKYWLLLGPEPDTVRQTLDVVDVDMFQRGRSADLDHLSLRAEERGCRNGAELWRRLHAQGFRGSLRAVGEWATRQRRSKR